MFKYIVLYSVLTVSTLTQCQPIDNAKNRVNRHLGTRNKEIFETVSTTGAIIILVNNQAANATSLTISQTSDAVSQIDSRTSNTANIESHDANTVNHVGQQVVDAATQISSQVQQQYEYQKATVGQLIDLLGESTNLTIIKETDSIIKALKSIGIATGHTFQAGLDTLGTGFDMILIVPKFTLNALGINKPTTVTL